MQISILCTGTTGNYYGTAQTNVTKQKVKCSKKLCHSPLSRFMHKKSIRAHIQCRVQQTRTECRMVYVDLHNVMCACYGGHGSWKYLLFFNHIHRTQSRKSSLPNNIAIKTITLHSPQTFKSLPIHLSQNLQCLPTHNLYRVGAPNIHSPERTEADPQMAWAYCESDTRVSSLQEIVCFLLPSE